MEEIRHGGIFIGGVWRTGSDTISVRNAFDDAPVGTVVRATPADVSDAIEAAEAALDAPFPAHLRYDVLMDVAARIDAQAENLSLLLAREGSKTITEAQFEPPRAAKILRLAAEAAHAFTGETLPFDARPGSENRRGYYVRAPAGVVAGIMAFNDPMAVAAHKVGPAIAAGNSVVLKPDSRTPFTAIRLAEAFEAAGLPAGRLNVVTGHGKEIGDALVGDARVRVVAFTGGVGVGQRITRTAGVKRLLLELGANSAVIVMPDADLDAACDAVVSAAFAQAGQNCLGVQRVFLHRAIERDMTERLVGRTSALRAGHSLDPEVDVCQMITRREADRVASWVKEAVAGGARIQTGGVQNGAVYEPTILVDVPRGARIECEELYGPVMALYPFDTLDEAIVRVNDVPYGLHAAVFTESLRHAFHAADRLRVGAVLVNDATNYRLDGMPFGGVGGSGIGREGIKFAVEAMTETRVVCFNL